VLLLRQKRYGRQVRELKFEIRRSKLETNSNIEIRRKAGTGVSAAGCSPHGAKRHSRGAYQFLERPATKTFSVRRLEELPLPPERKPRKNTPSGAAPV